MMKVEIDPALCRGDGHCAELCPQVFRVEHGRAHVVVDEVPPELEETCRLARRHCPGGAIWIEEPREPLGAWLGWLKPLSNPDREPMARHRLPRSQSPTV
jgi:ferredoxin